MDDLLSEKGAIWCGAQHLYWFLINFSGTVGVRDRGLAGRGITF